MKTIKIKNIINSSSATNTISGNKVYNAIIDSAKEGDLNIVLDFEDLTLINTAFLGNAIGNLFSNDDFKTRNLSVSIRNYPQELMGMLKECISNAQNFAQ